MAASNINRVVITGNLTRDPELRSLPSGNSVCSLRIASNTRRKDRHGEWVDKPNYFSVTVWGAQGENCNRFLTKGRPVCIDGRLEWREWQDKDGNKRESVEIVADSVQFLGGPADGNGGGCSGAPGAAAGNGFAPHSDVPADTSDFAAGRRPQQRARRTTTSRSRQDIPSARPRSSDLRSRQRRGCHGRAARAVRSGAGPLNTEGRRTSAALLGSVRVSA